MGQISLLGILACFTSRLEEQRSSPSFAGAPSDEKGIVKRSCCYMVQTFVGRAVAFRIY